MIQRPGWDVGQENQLYNDLVRLIILLHLKIYKFRMRRERVYNLPKFGHINFFNKNIRSGLHLILLQWCVRHVLSAPEPQLHFYTMKIQLHFPLVVCVGKSQWAFTYFSRRQWSASSWDNGEAVGTCCSRPCWGSKPLQFPQGTAVQVHHFLSILRCEIMQLQHNAGTYIH